VAFKKESYSKHFLLISIKGIYAQTNRLTFVNGRFIAYLWTFVHRHMMIGVYDPAG